MPTSLTSLTEIYFEALPFSDDEEAPITDAASGNWCWITRSPDHRTIISAGNIPNTNRDTPLPIIKRQLINQLTGSTVFVPDVQTWQRRGNSFTFANEKRVRS